MLFVGDACHDVCVALPPVEIVSLQTRPSPMTGIDEQRITTWSLREVTGNCVSLYVRVSCPYQFRYRERRRRVIIWQHGPRSRDRSVSWLRDGRQQPMTAEREHVTIWQLSRRLPARGGRWQPMMSDGRIRMRDLTQQCRRSILMYMFINFKRCVLVKEIFFIK